MPMRSSVHQLFSAEQGQAYIHALRWKDRPLQCPRCHSREVDPWGNYHYRPGCKRDWGHGCKRTCNDLTDTRLHQSKRPLSSWMLATLLVCLACSSRRSAREVGVHTRTSCRWGWWPRNAALSYEMPRRLEGTVEADERYHTAGNQGQAKHGGKKHLGPRARGRRKKREPGRGPYEKDRPAIIARVSRQGPVVVQAARDVPVKTVQTAADIAVQAGSRLYTDSASSCRALQGYKPEYVNHTHKESARGEVHEHRSECVCSLRKPYLRVFRGVSKLNLPGYVGSFQCLRNLRQQNAFKQAELILQTARDSGIAGRAKKQEVVKCFAHFDLLHTAINRATLLI